MYGISLCVRPDKHADVSTDAHTDDRASACADEYAHFSSDVSFYVAADNVADARAVDAAVNITRNCTDTGADTDSCF